MLHFFGEILVAVTRKIGNRLLVLGLVVAVINIQQFQYPGFPFVPVLFGEFLGLIFSLQLQGCRFILA